MNWHEKAQTFLLQGDYDQLAHLYEQAIETEPDVFSHYCYLGLAYLLQGKEEEAQATWMLAMVDASDAEVNQVNQELTEILDTEAQRQADLNNFQTAWLIRQHLREIVPNEVNNLLYILLLSLNLGNFNPELINDWQIVTVLEQSSPATVNSELIFKAIKKILEFQTEETFAFVAACLPHVQPPELFMATVIPIAVDISYQQQRPDFAIKLLELCLKLFPEHPGALQHLSSFHTNLGHHQEGIEVAKQFYNNCQSLDWKILGSYLIMRAMVSAGAWLEMAEVIKNHESLLLQIIEEQPEDLDKGGNLAVFVAPFFLPYLQDDIAKNLWFRNQVGKLFQKNFKSNISSTKKAICTDFTSKSRPLKIGYVAHTFKIHSVGWLNRWLFHYHDRELFPTTIYCINQSIEERFTQAWFIDKVNVTRNFGLDAPAVAEQIRKDEIDILVDLDSLTLDNTCDIMAMKPAPIQVTWLGWDASGMPTIDYFIADPYVLPENAQEYYQETIWRLPQTYIAVDGFEVGTPTLRRDELNIPSDAVVYFSAQKGYKRHPDTVRLQMKILNEVPNSYFLVKGKADEETIQKFFSQIAEEEGVDPGRLRFLGTDPNELVHRANLAIADVVLDTFPYNGATTTLETLWMGIPLVTKVGQQFSARNSYAFMMNVGVTEGIAWTDEEYVEWGVRLGKDEALRWKIAGKLKASRQTSPLWNAKQFTREMENAYRQMWNKYLESI